MIHTIKFLLQNKRTRENKSLTYFHNTMLTQAGRVIDEASPFVLSQNPGHILLSANVEATG